MRKDTLPIALIAASTTLATFVTIAPSLETVYKSPKSGASADSLRVAEVTTGVLAVGLGVACSAVTSSRLPLVASILSLVLMVSAFEFSLHNEKEVPK